jgi:hypothetical protein
VRNRGRSLIFNKSKLLPNSNIFYRFTNHYEELDGLAINALRSRKLSNVGQSLDQKFIIWSFGRDVQSLVPAAFAVVSTHLPALGLRGGLWPVLHMCNP